MLVLLAGCDNMFFQPDHRQYLTPEQFGLWHEEVRFRSAGGTRLSGWFLPAKGRALGTIIHFHGNAANISNHLYAVRWLPDAGYNVFMFDYSGYGESEGSASRKAAVADGVAAIEYVRQRQDVDAGRLVVYGQSLGGALAVSALARAGTQGVAALVIEGGFLSYPQTVRLILKHTWFSWPFQYPVAYLFFSDELDPAQDLSKIAAVPLLVVHGTADQVVPIEAGRALYNAFPGPDKAFWPIPDVGHIEAFSNPGSPWREPLLQYLSQKLGPLPVRAQGIPR